MPCAEEASLVRVADQHAGSPADSKSDLESALREQEEFAVKSKAPQQPPRDTHPHQETTHLSLIHGPKKGDDSKPPKKKEPIGTTETASVWCPLSPALTFSKPPSQVNCLEASAGALRNAKTTLLQLHVAPRQLSATAFRWGKN